MKDDETPPEGPSGSRAAGGCFLILLAGGAMAALLTVAPVAGTLVLWGGGAVWLWYAANKRMPDTPNPAPPPPSEGVAEEEPQFSVVKDPNHPNRHLVVWGTEKEQS